MQFKKILLLDNIPYLLSLIVVCVGWTMTYVVNKVEKFPILEYHVRMQEVIRSDTDTFYDYEYLITNLTFDRKFDSIDLYFTYHNSNNWQIIPGRTTAVGVAPAIFDAVGDAEKNPLVFSIKSLAFQPQAILKVNICVNGQRSPELFFQAKEEIMLVEKSLLTIVYRNYLYIFVFLTILWIILIILYLYAYVSNKPRFQNRKR